MTPIKKVENNEDGIGDKVRLSKYPYLIKVILQIGHKRFLRGRRD